MQAAAQGDVLRGEEVRAAQVLEVRYPAQGGDGGGEVAGGVREDLDAAAPQGCGQVRVVPEIARDAAVDARGQPARRRCVVQGLAALQARGQFVLVALRQGGDEHGLDAALALCIQFVQGQEQVAEIVDAALPVPVGQDDAHADHGCPCLNQAT
ncbi:MAG: hypothetical protein A2051_10325 [Desulfovibrionales bacterium GWA2_65_9]|nr:MAG: hypothetical protein A2051_10325 [Desulfovibrionales bacterium GWA2_65_9]